MIKRKHFFRKAFFDDCVRVHNCVTGEVFEFNSSCMLVLDFIWEVKAVTLSELKRDNSIKGINSSDLIKFLLFLKMRGFIETDEKQDILENNDGENTLS